MRTGKPGKNGDTEGSAPRVLLTGACGQIGSELVPYLRDKVGAENVIASDVKTTRAMMEKGPFVYCDVQDKDNLARIILENGVTHVIHLATLLSAVGERNPQLALRVNTSGIQNVLDLAASHGLLVYAPSTIAVFGNSSVKDSTPDDAPQHPDTMYGITKVHQELLGRYYSATQGVDYRSLRYPGILSASSPPGGGTTDYAVDIFHSALTTGHYDCFLSPNASLPMMYMPDCLEATWQLLTADKECLTRTTYNVGAVSFSPQELAEAIRVHIPHFTIRYAPDFRDKIASTWPNSVNDTRAREDWGWQHRYDMAAMAEDMLSKVEQRLREKAAEAADGVGRRRKVDGDKQLWAYSPRLVAVT
jgi:threonine 3-dehydrogenase